jgi:hypothetical protein
MFVTRGDGRSVSCLGDWSIGMRMLIRGGVRLDWNAGAGWRRGLILKIWRVCGTRCRSEQLCSAWNCSQDTALSPMFLRDLG